MGHRVQDLMSRNVISVGPQDTMRRVWELFREHGFHHLLVVEGDAVRGVVTDRDLLKLDLPFVGRSLEHEPDSAALARSVGEVATRRPVTVRTDARIAEAARTMLTADVTCLPVVDSADRLAGILTVRDVLKHVVDEDAD